MSSLLSTITTIPEDVLTDPFQRMGCSVARRMSWAKSRKTTREEDVAYCLLGIFNVHMPLLHGEGKRAFIRLQEEIMKETDDQSLFAWGLLGQDYLAKCSTDEIDARGSIAGVLAIEPANFAGSENVVPFPSKPGRQPYLMTNKGLRIELPLLTYNDNFGTDSIAMLDCHYENDFSGPIGISLKQAATSSVFTRFSCLVGRKYPAEHVRRIAIETIYIVKQLSKTNDALYGTCLIRWESIQSQGYQFSKLAQNTLAGI